MNKPILSGMLGAAILVLGACAKEKEPEPNPGAQEQGAFQPDEMHRKLAEPPLAMPVEMPEPNARRGRIIFVTRACVICHEVNGVGGKAAPSLGARPSQATVNPLEFSARMWRGATAMTALQSVELGYVIDLDAQDIADLAAFAASADEQALLTLESVPVELRDWFINERYWENEDWADYLARGARIPKMQDDENLPH
ncbi:MAG TPA: c-type cytochrome [Parvularculaceae bacterium]|nr:hypothetical protein [Amphiplicatus sp.]MCB9954808.1 hypothetical protein [Caulobacterales bacterium]HPE31602.1 c-type cytochrome [Parvularculaceae bacterium]HRX39335.1 c-type cytochrome [Parvularculaceae bacterium]